MEPIELIAVVFGLLCVILTIRQNILCWPTGLVMVILYVWIFYHARLYSDMGLQVVYIFMQIYGWVHWAKGGTRNNTLPVTLLSRNNTTLAVLITMFGAILLGTAMHRLTNASLPYIDAFTTVASLMAQWLLTRKKLESWLFWIVVDVISVGMYLYKELFLTSFLYLIFLALAILGYFTWRKECKAL